MAEAELREITERAVEAYGKPLDNVSTFKYLGRVMTALSVISLNSASAIRRLFRSTPFSHCAVAGCLPFSALHGTSM